MRRFYKFFRLLSSPVWRRGLKQGVGASIEHDAALLNGAFKTIVDIGANKGQFALYCEDRFPGSQITSFEPLPGPAAIFRNVFAEQARVELIEVAVSPEAGTTEIHVSKRDDSSSLLPITDLQNSLFPGTAEQETITIKTSPLDQHLSASNIVLPALLKMDVQGFELEALKGSQSLLGYFSQIYVECSYVELYEGQSLAPDIIAYLNSQGFELRQKFNETIDPKIGPIQADFLFSKKI